MKVINENDLVDDSSHPIIAIAKIEQTKKDNIQRATINVFYLKSALKIIEGLGWQEVTICVQDDNPILFEKDKGNNKGLIIAPIVDK